MKLYIKNMVCSRFDSYSGRISYNPNAYWAFQVSEGFIKSPEITRPGENVYRTTASAVYSKPLRNRNFLNVTGLWGMNTIHGSENAALLEAALVLKRWSVYTRYEWVEKTREELDLSEGAYRESAIFPVNAMTLSLGYDILRTQLFNMAIGVQGSYFAFDSRLNSLYGKNPASAEIYIRIYPPRMMMRKM